MEASDNEQYFFNFSFFKLDSKWRWMADLAKEESAKEVENVIINSGIKFRSYSTLGLRDDADFLFWFAAESVDEIQNVSGVITAFPGGVVGSGSKIGSKYDFLTASTNEAYCPTLKGQVKTALTAEIGSVLEIVIDGIDEKCQELQVLCGCGARGQQVDARVCLQAPVIVLAATINIGKRLFMKQHLIMMPLGNLIHQVHDQ